MVLAYYPAANRDQHVGIDEPPYSYIRIPTKTLISAAVVPFQTRVVDPLVDSLVVSW